MAEFRVLTVQHVGKDAVEDCRVTIAPSQIKYVTAKDIERRERQLKMVKVYFIDGTAEAVCVSPIELTVIESAVGMYKV